MNLDDPKYRQFAICHEMLDSCKVIRNFDIKTVDPYLEDIRKKKKLFITGEGSSKIFPASHLIYRNLQVKSKFNIVLKGLVFMNERRI